MQFGFNNNNNNNNKINLLEVFFDFLEGKKNDSQFHNRKKNKEIFKAFLSCECINKCFKILHSKENNKLFIIFQRY